MRSKLARLYGNLWGCPVFLRIIWPFSLSLKVLCDKFSHTRFEPSGWSGNPEIGYAKSLTDYIARLCAAPHKRAYVSANFMLSKTTNTAALYTPALLKTT